jgi:hypothetical protein
MQYLKITAVLFVLALSAACASGPPKPIHVDEMKEPGVGLIYGQLRMPNEDWNHVKLVMIQRVGKVYGGMGLKGLSEKVHITRDGRYVAANLKPGKYMLAGFVIGSESNFLGKNALNYTIEVKAGGLHYLGTYKYVITKASNMIRPGSFDLVQDETRASHVELLNWVEEGVRATKWHGPIKRKLAGLQGGGK